MSLPLRPTQGLDDPNQLRRDRETINDILTFRFDDSRIRTDAEIALGKTPRNFAYPPGDPRRWHDITVTDDEIKGLYCHGFVPTYVDGDTFTMPGDVRSYFPDRTRIAVFSASARKYGQILSTSFGTAGVTTVEMRMEDDNLPTSPIAVLNYVGVQFAHMNTFMMDYDGAQVMQVINQNTGEDAAAQVLVGNFVDSGIGIIGTFPTTVGSFPGGVYYSLAPNNPIAAVTTGLDIPLCLVTNDRCRIIIDGDGGETQVTTNFVVQHTNELPGGSATAISAADGTETAKFEMRVASTPVAELSSTTTATFLGTAGATPLRLATNGLDRLIIPAGGLGNYANDGAAAAGGVAVGEIYRNGSALMIRVA